MFNLYEIGKDLDQIYTIFSSNKNSNTMDKIDNVLYENTEMKYHHEFQISFLFCHCEGGLTVTDFQRLTDESEVDFGDAVQFLEQSYNN